MELHHSKHHAAYVAGANAALAQLAEAREKGDFANINRLSKDLAFHSSTAGSDSPMNTVRSPRKNCISSWNAAGTNSDRP
jgi:superoxide dismutase